MWVLLIPLTATAIAQAGLAVVCFLRYGRKTQQSLIDADKSSSRAGYPAQPPHHLPAGPAYGGFRTS